MSDLSVLEHLKDDESKLDLSHKKWKVWFYDIHGFEFHVVVFCVTQPEARFAAEKKDDYACDSEGKGYQKKRRYLRTTRA